MARQDSSKGKSAAGKKAAKKKTASKKAAKKKTARKKMAKKKAVSRKSSGRSRATAKPAADKAALAKIDPEHRRRMIAETAYFIAERRGFVGGDTRDDWLQAEILVDRLLESEQD